MKIRGVLGDGDPNVDPYQNWIAQQKAQGATIVGNPIDTGSLTVPKDAPMARYPIATAQALGLTNPDTVSGSGNYWYFVAPPDVLTFFFTYDMSLAPSAEAVKKGTEQLEPEWYKRLSATAQAITVVAIAGAVIYGLTVAQSLRPKTNPPRRRRRRHARGARA